MKKTLASLPFLLLFPLLVAQSGKVFDNLSMPSKILKMDRKYAVYLPPDYETSGRSYPVLYLLHGGGDDHTGWVQFGEVQHIADRAIGEGTATPMIIVMPDANTGRRGYTNSAKGDWLYEDFFFQEFMPHVEKTYRIKADKHYRAVAGLSMGGHGSFIFALHHPELFAAACPLSAATGPKTRDELRFDASEGVTETQKEAYFKKYSVLDMIASIPDEVIKSTKPEDRAKRVRWYIDCGDDDFLYEGNALVHIAMRQKGIAHEYRVRDGIHNWVYWRAALPRVLEFVTMDFHQF
ncbi:MAG: esterase family protein [Bacteroidales bacterium]|jgi:enterochelin esterase-like enzyme|nr:esterase family protein [Bacteroidales bacterium]